MPDSDGRTFADAEIFGLLRNHRRRYILQYLLVEENLAEFDDLVDTVAAWENEIPVEAVTAAQRKRVYVSLTQTHLPKLDDAGVIEYDEEAGTVRRLPAAGEIEQYMGLDEDRRPWPLVYFVASLVGIALALGQLLSAPVFRDLPVHVLTFLILGLFLAVSVAHLVTGRR